MLLNRKVIGFGVSKEVLTPERLMQAYGNRMRLVDADGKLMTFDEDCCGDE
jgi:ABC-type cobalamin transport system ATPase subunit